MKKWMRFAALVLAGVMTLLMFTACSDSSSQAETTQVEAAVLNQLSQKAGASFENNGTLRNLAYQTLGKIDAETGKISWKDAHTVTTSDGQITYVNVATSGSVINSDGSVDANSVTSISSSKLLEWMEEHNLFRNLDFSLNLPWVNVGVAAKKINGNIYIAVAVSVSWK